VRIISYRLDEFYVSEVESASSGATIAMIVATIPEEARREALETAARRLLRTRDLELTVGG